MPDKPDQFLLQRFVAGECTPEEIALVNRFLQQETGKAMMTELLQEQWLQAASFEMEQQELQAYKMQLQARISPAAAPLKSVSIITLFRRYGLRAAVWVGLLLSMAAVYKLFSVVTVTDKKANSAIAMKVVANPNGRRASVRLPDSSLVFLGPGSSIQYPAVFQGNTREVLLEGEAFFEVTGDAAMPFVVRTGEVYTRVLGTAFKVEAFAGKRIHVGVTSGKVRVDQYLDGKPVKELAVLTAGHKMLYTPEGNVKAAALNVQEVEAWLKGRLVFNGAPLQELTETMERWRDVQFVIQRKELLNMPVTVTVDKNVSLHQLLEGLSLVGDFKYTIDKHKVIIY